MMSKLELRMWALTLKGTAATVARLREFAPYTLMDLVLPGGPVMAVLFWLYRRKRNEVMLATVKIAEVA